MKNAFRDKNPANVGCLNQQQQRSILFIMLYSA